MLLAWKKPNVYYLQIENVIVSFIVTAKPKVFQAAWQQLCICCLEARLLMREKKDGRKEEGNELLGCPMRSSANPLVLLALVVQRETDTQPPITS